MCVHICKREREGEREGEKGISTALSLGVPRPVPIYKQGFNSARKARGTQSFQRDLAYRHCCALHTRLDAGLGGSSACPPVEHGAVL